MSPKTPKTLAQVEEQRPAPIQDEATALIAQAIDKNLPVETMEKLLAMRRELKAEKALESFNRAMTNFQRDCPTIQKKTKGYNYMYADLTTIIEQVKGLLAENGLSYTFNTDEVDNKIAVYCIVTHIDGHTAKPSTAIITKETTTKMNASQQSGASMTYGKRYAVVNAFGILTGDEDTDAATTHPSPTPKIEAPKPITMITDDQKGDMMILLGKLHKTSEDLNKVVKAKFKIVDSYKNLTEQQAEQLLEYMRDRVSKLPVGEFESPDLTDEELTKIDEGIEEQKSGK